MKIRILLGLLISTVLMAAVPVKADSATKGPSDHRLEKATFAGGCFWCMEEAFEGVEGVVSVTSGYTGGNKPHPAYEEVSAGGTGHAEAVEILYDPAKVSYAKLLEVFWRNIDPTTPDRQFCDGSSATVGISIALPSSIRTKHRNGSLRNRSRRWRNRSHSKIPSSPRSCQHPRSTSQKITTRTSTRRIQSATNFTSTTAGGRSGYRNSGERKASRMLKKASSFVLASLRGSTYGKEYASPLRSLWPRWATFLNILDGWTCPV